MFYDIKKYINRSCIALLTVAALVSCTRDNIAAPADTAAGNAMVKLSIYTPSSSAPRSGTRSASDNEDLVARVKVIVLEQDGDSYKYGYSVNGQNIVQETENRERSTFTALLRGSATPLKLLLVANWNDAFDPDPLLDGMDEQAVKQALIDGFDSNAMSESLPLYGEVSLTQLKTDQTSVINATMLRGVAQVEVVNMVDENVYGEFRLNEVFIYRAGDKLRLIPDDGAMKDGEVSVAGATVPAGTAHYPAYSKTVQSAEQSIKGLYLPESLPAADGDRVTGATCVVVGGYYKDKLCYYRIDFDSKIEGHPLGQVLRNHKYVFHIQGITYEGWEEPDDAANNESTAVIATLQVWDEVTSEMYFYGNDEYLGISSRRVVLDYFDNSERTVYLQATVPFGIIALDADGVETGQKISQPGEGFTNGFFDLKLVKDSSDGQDIFRIVITSNGYNYTDGEFEGYFKVVTDFWEFDVTVVQESYYGVYSNRFVRILTITSLTGDLGMADGTLSDHSGGAMRKVLENTANFSPTGTVPIGGVIVYDLLNSTISSSGSEQMFILRKMLDNIDVVHMAQGSTPSIAASQIIYDWLMENSNRVLIIGTDDVSTNANLITYFTEMDGTWKEAEPSIAALATDYEDSDGRHEPFYHGSFGDVPQRTAMGYVEGNMGYNNGYTWETTTCLLSIMGAPDNDGLLTHGVNVGLGVVYFGESEVFTSNSDAMSQQAYEAGQVVTEMDILMANLWEWIITRVVRGLPQ